MNNAGVDGENWALQSGDAKDVGLNGVHRLDLCGCGGGLEKLQKIELKSKFLKTFLKTTHSHSSCGRHRAVDAGADESIWRRDRAADAQKLPAKVEEVHAGDRLERGLIGRVFDEAVAFVAGRRRSRRQLAEYNRAESLEDALDVLLGELRMDRSDVNSVVVLGFFLNLVDDLLLFLRRIKV